MIIFSMKKIDKYDVRTDLLYDPENHFWLDINDGKAVIGMSPLVQETSGSFVAIQMEKVGTSVEKNMSFGTAEAEKHVGPLKAPVSGRILTCNEKVIENPRLINLDPYGQGWLVEVELEDIENERKGLISGEEDITKWFTAELKKFDEKGWIAH